MKNTTFRNNRKHGQHIAEEFAKWINSDGKPQDMFRPLLESTVALAKGLKKRHARFGTFDLHQKKNNSILARIDRKYPSRLQLVGFWDDGAGRHEGPNSGPDYREKPIGRYRRDAEDVLTALRRFRLIAEYGFFANFSQCSLSTCGKYFYPLRPERRYCSDACQRTAYVQDPGRKDKNAADQKVYYYSKKVLDLAKLAASNAAYQKEYSHAKKTLKLAKLAASKLKGR
jgi:hypothetical protein